MRPFNNQCLPAGVCTQHALTRGLAFAGAHEQASENKHLCDSLLFLFGLLNPTRASRSGFKGSGMTYDESRVCLQAATRRVIAHCVDCLKQEVHGRMVRESTCIPPGTAWPASTNGKGTLKHRVAVRSDGVPLQIFLSRNTTSNPTLDQQG